MLPTKKRLISVFPLSVVVVMCCNNVFYSFQNTVNASNVVQVSQQLAEVTKSPTLITNRVDIKFIVDTIVKIVEVQQKTIEVCIANL